VLYGLLFLALTVVALSTLIWMLYAWRHPEQLEATRFPVGDNEPRHSFSLIVPARHEEAVLEQTLERLVALDHPAYEILVVVGHDDEGTHEVARRVAEQHPHLIKVAIDENWPKNKPKALNTALPLCRGDIVGVFDAEDIVAPELLKQVDNCFTMTEADIVQGATQLMNFRSRWYSTRNVLEYYFWFKSRLHFHAAKRFIPLGGNTVFIRSDLLRISRGWDPECLAEDCELGARLSSLGARTVVAYDPALVTKEETPGSVQAFVRQRTRWNQGYLQVLKKGYWRALPLPTRLLAVYTLAFPFLQAAAGLLVPLAIIAALFMNLPILLTLVSFLPLAVVLLILIVEAVGLSVFCSDYGARSRPRDYVRLTLTLVPYQLILSYAAMRAVVRESLGQRSWEKTEHAGLHFDVERPQLEAA
jgi:cellulose synthase/poly-beta-1,6-N-acetylglucosamine synthase-like glycosyltransferase